MAHASMVPDKMYRRVLMELTNVIVKPFSMIFENLWQSGEIPVDWKRETLYILLKRVERETPGNYSPATPVSRRIINRSF